MRFLHAFNRFSCDCILRVDHAAADFSGCFLSGQQVFLFRAEGSAPIAAGKRQRAVLRRKSDRLGTDDDQYIIPFLSALLSRNRRSAEKQKIRLQHQKPAAQAVGDLPGGFGAGGMDLHAVLIETPFLTRLYEKKNAVTLMKKR